MRRPSLFRRLVSCGLIASSSIFAPLTAPKAQANSPLVIGEVAWAGSSLSLADEWIEIWNLGNETVALGGFSLVGAAPSPLAFPTDAVIPARGSYLIANYSSEDAESTLAATPQFVTTALSLSNSALGIALVDPQGVTLDQVGDGGKPTAGSSGDIKASMIRNDLGWDTATVSRGFDLGSSDLGTPGTCDGCTIQPELTPEPIAATTTEPVVTPPNEPTDAPTPPSPEEAIENPVSTISEPEAVAQPPIEDPVLESIPVLEPTEAASSTPPEYSDAPRFDLVRLNEFMPQPDGEEEWIEVVSLDPAIAVALDGLTLHDATGKIFTFTSSTVLDANTPFIRVDLSSAKLNNGGDTLALHDPNGVSLDSVSYESSKKGESWARRGDGAGNWEMTATPTPAASNVFSTEPAPVPDIVATSTPDVLPPAPEEAPVAATTTTESAAGAQNNEISPSVATSTTEMNPPMTTEVASTTNASSQTNSSASPSTNSASAPTTPPENTAAPTPRYDLLRVNEFMARPESGQEWIEVTSLDLNIAISLSGMEIHDGSGKIYTFATGTIDQLTPYVTTILSSARLNNDGDTIALKTPNGNVVESIAYDASTAGMSWARSPNGTGSWIETSTLTLGAANPVAASSTPSSTQETLAATTPTQASNEVPASTGSNLPSLTSSSVAANNTPATPAVNTSIQTPSVATKATAPAAKTTAKTSTVSKTTTAKKTTSKAAIKAEPTYLSITHDMTTNESHRGIRVSLQGVAGSQSGLLSSHAFILLSPEGRGLQVRVPTARKLPTMGDIVVVNGTLMFTDAGMPYLKINTTDEWKTLKDVTQTSLPRSADLFTPGAEDAWSLVKVTGVVRRMRPGAATIEVDGADIDIVVRKVVDFRLARLTIGDTVAVTGVLDASSDIPRLLPRTADEIQITAHAKPEEKKAGPATLPGWTPFGAAGIAIAGTEGLKQLRERRKKRALEEIVESRLNTTV